MMNIRTEFTADELDTFIDQTNIFYRDRKEPFESDAEYLYRTLKYRVTHGTLSADDPEFLASRQAVVVENKSTYTLHLPSRIKKH